MKQLTVFLATITMITASGQIDPDLIKTNVKVDKMDEKILYNTEPMRFDSNYGRFEFGLVQIDDEEDTYALSMDYVIVEKDGCFVEQNNKIRIKLADGEVYDLTQISGTECGDSGHLYYIFMSKEDMRLDANAQEINIENYNIITSQPWVLIRVYGSEGYYELEPSFDKKTKTQTGEYFMLANASIEKAKANQKQKP